nr:uncharacterized protein LOC109187834 [Ipomoea batatas]
MVSRPCATPSGDIFEFLNYIWQQWSIQAIVLGSLAFQVVLIFSAPSRIRTKNNSCILTLWSVYLLADYIATFGIALINNDSKIDESSSSSSYCGAFKDDNAIAALWAPFLLLHLGGPDTITAFAIEDNELWTRHLVTMIAQVLAVLLVFYRYGILENNRFLIPTALIFIAGVIKCGERIRSLSLASQDSLKKSMREPPDAGPDYHQLMEEMASKQAANLPVTIDINRDKGAKADDVDDVVDMTQQYKELEELEVIKHGYKFFRIFKGLIVDHMFSFLEREDSRRFYRSLEYNDAFRVMEMELNFMYDAMFTKMSAVQCILGYIFRFISTALLIAATLIFSRQSHHHIHLSDIMVTYFLLGGGVALDLIAILELIFSKWTIAALLVGSEKSVTASASAPNWRKTVAEVIKRVKGIIPTKRWSEEMHQYSFINHTLHKQKWPNWVSYIIDKFGLTEAVCSCLYGKTQQVEEKMKYLIFNEIKKKSMQAINTRFAGEIASSKGEWTLLDYSNCDPYIHFSVSQDVDYDECVLMWHIATEIFYFSSSRANNSRSDDYGCNADICRHISEYLLYLLVMERKMITVDNKFRDTFEEANKFFNRGKQKKAAWGSYFSACETLFFKNVKDSCCLYLYSMVLSTWEDIKYVFTLECFTTEGRERKPTMWEEHQYRLEDEKRKDTCKKLKVVRRPQVMPSEVKGDRTHLEKLCRPSPEDMCPYTENEVWEMMSKVWVELLSYGAYHCRGDTHAQSLTKGGELRTFVWLLMAHFGLGEHFRNDLGPSRVKLIVGKEFN